MLLTIIQKGGFMIYPVILCSVIALGITADRLYVLLRVKFTPDDIFEKFLSLIRKGKNEDASEVILKSESSFKKIYTDIISSSNEKEQEKTAFNSGTLFIENLSNRVQILSIIASVTPIMGLLGTVLGMVNVFSDIAAQNSAVDIGVLSSGIWEALISTAAGLAVAIPSLISYRLIRMFLEKSVNRMQRKINLLISACTEKVND